MLVTDEEHCPPIVHECSLSKRGLLFVVGLFRRAQPDRPLQIDAEAHVDVPRRLERAYSDRMIS